MAENSAEGGLPAPEAAACRFLPVHCCCAPFVRGVCTCSGVSRHRSAEICCLGYLLYGLQSFCSCCGRYPPAATRSCFCMYFSTVSNTGHRRIYPPHAASACGLPGRRAKAKMLHLCQPIYRPDHEPIIIVSVSRMQPSLSLSTGDCSVPALLSAGSHSKKPLTHGGPARASSLSPPPERYGTVVSWQQRCSIFDTILAQNVPKPILLFHLLVGSTANTKEASRVVCRSARFRSPVAALAFMFWPLLRMYPGGGLHVQPPAEGHTFF